MKTMSLLKSSLFKTSKRGFLSKLFKPTVERYNTPCDYVSLTSQNEVEYNTESDILFDSKNEIILKNYSSVLTPFDLPNETIGLEYQNSNTFNPTFRDQIIGKSFCGIIDYMPNVMSANSLLMKLGRNNYEFKEGSKVFGTNFIRSCASTFSQYAPIHLTDILMFKCPDNVPLHYGATYAWGFRKLHEFLKNSGTKDAKSFENKNILLLGTDEYVPLNAFLIYFLDACKVNNLTIVLSNKRHKTIFDRINDERITVIEDKTDYFNSQLLEESYDLIIDSLSTSSDSEGRDSIIRSVLGDSNAKKTRLYWVLKDPIFDILKKYDSRYSIMLNDTRDFGLFQKQISRKYNVKMVRDYEYIMGTYPMGLPFFVLQPYCKMIEEFGGKYPILMEKCLEFNEENFNYGFEYVKENFNRHSMVQNVNFVMNWDESVKFDNVLCMDEICN